MHDDQGRLPGPLAASAAACPSWFGREGVPWPSPPCRSDLSCSSRRLWSWEPGSRGAQFGMANRQAGKGRSTKAIFFKILLVDLSYLIILPYVNSNSYILRATTYIVNFNRLTRLQPYDYLKKSAVQLAKNGHFMAFTSVSSTFKHVMHLNLS